MLTRGHVFGLIPAVVDSAFDRANLLSGSLTAS